MAHASPDHFQLEPTVVGAVQRYPSTVVIVVLISLALVLGLKLAEEPVFEAQATVTVPLPEAAEGQTPEQYLASQLLLLQSPDVAERAAGIANRSLGNVELSAEDFKGEEASLDVVPPEASSPGTYGANIMTVTFTWPNARVAQAGANSALQAFDDVRSDAIKDQGDAAVAAIERTLEDSRTREQVGALVNQRAEILVNQAIDLTRHPTVAWATVPQDPLNGDWKRSVAVGLLLGLVLGAAIAYVEASRRRSFDDPLQPGELYGAPLLGQVPSPLTGPGPVGRLRGHRRNKLTMAAAPHSAGAEAFRSIAASVQRLRAHAGDGVSVAFVSAAPDPTRSAVVANLALALGESGSSVLAVDADRGKLTAFLLPDHPGDSGFGDVLTGGGSTAEHCIWPSPLLCNVAVLPRGTSSARPMAGAAYLSAVERILDEGMRVHDVVTVDSPAVMDAAAAAELAHASDAVVIVMGPHEPVSHHQDVLRRLNGVGANVVGYIYYRPRPPSRSWAAGSPSLVTHMRSWKPSRRTS